MTSGRLSLSSRHCGSALFWRNEYNGHCMEEIVWALDHIRGSNNGKPKAIVCNTVKGKGVSFMENVPIWHGLAPDDEQYRIAMEDLERGF